MNTEYDNTTMAEFIERNDARINKIITDIQEGNADIAKIYLKHLISEAYTTGSFAGIERLSKAYK